MAVSTVVVNGKVLGPTGSGYSGKIVAELSARGYATDGGTKQWVGGKSKYAIASDGAVSFTILPNANLTPAGSHYVVTFTLDDPERSTWQEKWQVAATPDPVNIGEIPRV